MEGVHSKGGDDITEEIVPGSVKDASEGYHFVTTWHVLNELPCGIEDAGLIVLIRAAVAGAEDVDPVVVRFGGGDGLRFIGALLGVGIVGMYF